MNDNLAPAVIALLCILALGLSAATLTSAVGPTDDSATGSGEGFDHPRQSDSGSVDAETEDSLNNAQTLSRDASQGVCVDSANQLPTWPLVIGVSGLIGLLVSIPFGSRNGLRAFSLLVLPLLLLFLIGTAGCSIQASDGGVSVNGSGQATVTENESTPSGGNETTKTTDPLAHIPSILLAFTILFLVQVLLVMDDFGYFFDATPTEMTNPNDDVSTEVVGAVAGRTADRIASNADVNNEVYRAWGEMAAELDVDNPERSSPAEFAEAATEAGIRPDDARELTTLFEEVRYGTAEATSDRERQAIDALRRIERRYAGESDDDDEWDSDEGGDTD